MKKISIQDHDLLKVHTLKALAQNRISTILEFLQEDIEKLSIISTLKLTDILDIRNHILSRYSAPLNSCSTLLVKNLNNRKFISTNIQSLDAALEGGVPVGCITELCGLAGSGKTQLCFHLANNAAKSQGSVLYIDTKGDFSAIRIMKILEASGCNFEQMATLMSKIHIVHIWTMKDAVELLKTIKNGIIDNLVLLIIDSLPSLMFQHLGDDNKIGLTLLNDLVNNIRFINKELLVATVCVNIHTRWLDHDIADVDDVEESNLINKESFVERRNRCLGKYWQHIPSILLVIEKTEKNKHENKNSDHIQIQVHKSRLPKHFEQCSLVLDDLGIRSV